MTEPTHEDPRKIAAIVVGLTLVLAVMLLAFALPAANSGPRDVPLGLVGPEALKTQLEQGGQFDVTTYADADDARKAIENRDIYGAIVMSPTGSETLIATAGGASVAQTIQQVGTTLGATTVTDVHPFPADDARGAGLGAAGLPLAMGGFIGAVVISMVARSLKLRVAAIAAFAIVVGFTMTALLQFWIGTFDGNYLLTSFAAVFGIAATAAAVLGLRSLLGNAGIGVAALLIILLGNPLSGLANAPEMLPQPWGAIGQLLPPGATGTLLRNTAFFDGAGTTHAIVVLACWLVAGAALVAAATLRERRTTA